MSERTAFFVLVFIVTRLDIVVSSCSEGWVQDIGHGDCFRLYLTPVLNCRQAEAFCGREKSELAVLRDYRQQQFMHLYISTKYDAINNSGVWFGKINTSSGQRPGHVCSSWARKPEDNTEFNWINTSKRPVKYGGYCIQISTKFEEFGRLSVNNCDLKQPFLCRRENSSDSVSTHLVNDVPSCQSFLIPIAVLAAILFVIVVIIVKKAYVSYWSSSKRKPETSKCDIETSYRTNVGEISADTLAAFRESWGIPFHEMRVYSDSSAYAVYLVRMANDQYDEHKDTQVEVLDDGTSIYEVIKSLDSARACDSHHATDLPSTSAQPMPCNRRNSENKYASFWSRSGPLVNKMKNIWHWAHSGDSF